MLDAEDQNNEFDMTDQNPRSIRFNITVKAFRLQPNR